MSVTKVIFTAALFSFFTVNASEKIHADRHDPYFDIVSVDVQEVEPDYSKVYEVAPTDRAEKSELGAVIMQARELIAFGKEVWQIIEAGRPVSNHTAMSTITVLPKKEDGSAVEPLDMENWQLPSAKSYSVSYKNGFGMNVISFTYTVIFQYGGSFNGKGKYLTGVNVMADDISVAWGFNFEAQSQLVSITNVGSAANPVAAATLTIKYRAKSVIRDISSSETFFVTGSGRVGQLH